MNHSNDRVVPVHMHTSLSQGAPEGSQKDRWDLSECTSGKTHSGISPSQNGTVRK